MSQINPSGNTYDEDYALWHNANSKSIIDETRNIILIYFNGAVIGFFTYCIRDDEIFFMEEIQIAPQYQGKKYDVFRKLYGFIFTVLPPGIKIVKSYTNKMNHKAYRILWHLGLHIVGENERGSGYRFEGSFENLLAWYNRAPNVSTRAEE